MKVSLIFDSREKTLLWTNESLSNRELMSKTILE